MRRRHCEYVVARVEEAAAAWQVGGSPREVFFPVLDEELDNLRSALAWAAAAGELELEVRLGVAARWYWVVQGHLGEGRRAFDGIIARTVGAPKELRATALVQGAIFPFRQGDTRLSAVLLEESLDLYRELGDEEGVARAIAELGGIAIAELDLDKAAALYEEAVPLLRGLGNLARLATATANLGTIAHMRGDPASAVRLYAEAIELDRMANEEDALAVNLHNLGRSELQLGHTEQALAALHESLALARRLGYREVIAYLLGGFAEVAMHEDDAPRAATLLGASERLFTDIGRVTDPDEAEMHDRVAALVVDAIGPERAARLRAQGASQSLDELLDRVASAT